MEALEMRRGNTTTHIKLLADEARLVLETYASNEIAPVAVEQVLPTAITGPSEIFSQSNYFEGMPDMSDTPDEDYGSR